MPKRSVSVWTPFWGWVFYDPHLSSDENCYDFFNHIYIYWLVHKYPCLLWNWVVESPWITYVQQKQVFSQCSVQGRATDNCWNLSWSLRGQYVDDVLWVALKPHRKNQTLSDTATTQSFWTYFFLLNKRFVSVSIHELKKVGPGHVVSELCSMPKVSPLCLHGYWKSSHTPSLGFDFSWHIFSLANAVSFKARQPKHVSSILAVPRNMSPVWTSARGMVMFCLQSNHIRTSQKNCCKPFCRSDHRHGFPASAPSRSSRSTTGKVLTQPQAACHASSVSVMTLERELQLLKVHSKTLGLPPTQ